MFATEASGIELTAPWSARSVADTRAKLANEATERQPSAVCIPDAVDAQGSGASSMMGSQKWNKVAPARHHRVLSGRVRLAVDLP